MANSIKTVRGMHDILPPESGAWNAIETSVRDVFRIYNYQEIRTPIVEDLQLFQRGVGEETDIVSKEMFTWEDRARAQSEKGQSLALRPENTAGVVRAYIEHKLWERPGLQRFYYIGPQFRRERPAKGRYRQALRDALKPVVHTMCADCQRRAVTNPLRVLDCKVPEDQPIIEKLPRMSEYLDDDSHAHFVEVQKILTAMEVPFVIDHRLVRGLDYYTRTAFEFTHGALGAQNAILGGGRYDGLSESLGGPPAPGIGFAIGEDRLVMTLQETAGAAAQPADVYIAPLGAGMNAHAAQLARELRHEGIVV